MAKTNRPGNEPDEAKDETKDETGEDEEKEELTESALKGTHKSDFSLEQEQKAKEEECERTEGNCDESRK
ncbi:MAG: hypothetical protein IPG59_20490 [Candidatus Melainabacteria bacterium]|nr:MAG: hypothetical protein IPG59_20490 [Candidatus Melainabacteria bacterium]